MSEITELKNIPGLEPEQSVKISKMNYGFRSDLQGEVSNLSVKGNDGHATVNLQALKIYTLVYGIFESETLGITKPLDLDLGLNDEEKRNRVKVIRKMNGVCGDYLYMEINKENQETDEKLKKK